MHETGSARRTAGPASLPPSYRPTVPHPPVTIVGAGLAGACAAAALARTRPVTVWDDGRPGATGAAAGLANPFTGQSAHRAWRADDALAALHALDDLGATRWTGLLRPAATPKQARRFQRRAGEHAALDWLGADAVALRAPELVAPLGALDVREAGVVDLDALRRALLDRAQTLGAEVRHGTWTPGAITARVTILCAGAALARLAPSLALGAIKGQTITLRGAPPAIPPVAGRTYLVPRPDGTVVVGATFERDFAHGRPTDRATALLHARAAALVPALADAEVVDARAGVRVTVPTTASPHRLPILGPISDDGRLWAFGALGSRGLLAAPLLASWLPAALDDVEALPPEIRPVWAT